jgi:alpha-L-fucosidase 2
MNRVLFCLPAATAILFAAELKTDIEFARPDGVSLTLDASVPDGPGPFPTVIVVHGGGFVRGDKQTYVKPLFPVLTDASFAWFTINYRLAPKYRFPAPIRDVEAAVKWVQQNARAYKVDPKRIALVGESAGGHLVSYVGVTSAPRLGIAAVVPFYAPHDFVGRARQMGIGETTQQFLGIGSEMTRENLAVMDNASPSAHVKAGLPPFLLIHGTDDRLVPYSQSVRMQQKLKVAGVRCDLYTVEGGEHGMGSWEKLGKHEWKFFLVGWLKQALR